MKNISKMRHEPVANVTEDAEGVGSTFGSILNGRNWNAASAPVGFNGQMKDDDLYGTGNLYTAEYWEYDPRLGRRMNIDPVIKPDQSPYAAFANNPIWFVDENGADSTTYLFSEADENGKAVYTTKQLEQMKP